MNNKILVELYVTKLDEYYDVFIPCNKKVKNILSLVIKALNDITLGEFPSDYHVAFVNKATGQIYNPENTFKELGVPNGSKLMLI